MAYFEKRTEEGPWKAIWIIISIISVFGISVWIFTANNRTLPLNTGATEEQSSVEALGQEEPRSGAAVGPSQSAAQPKKSSGNSTTAGAVTIKLLTPASGETWAIRKTHEIQWSRPAARNGGIILLDAAAKNVVGWITPSLSGNQVSYSWNTNDVLLGRTNPAKKDIAPGIYVLRIVFDGAQPLDSAPFLVVVGSERIITDKVSVSGNIFSPSFVTEPRGNLVVISNNDAASRTLLMNGMTVAVLPQWNSYVFDTSKYSAGTYEVRLKEEVTARLEITIK